MGMPNIVGNLNIVPDKKMRTGDLGLLDDGGRILAEVCHQVGPDEKVDAYPLAHLFQAAPKFYAACKSGFDSDQDRLGWLRSYLVETEDADCSKDDPDAWFEARQQCWALLRELETAVKWAEGKA